MNCKEVEKIIPLFLNKELDDKKSNDFIEHVKQCKNCREELSIYFLIAEGITSLEEGNSFDLEKELDSRLEETTHRIKMRRTIKFSLYAFEILAVVIILQILLYFL